MSLVEIHGINKSYGSVQVLKDVTLDIAKGEGVGEITAAQFATGALLSFVFGLVVIHFFLGLIRRIGVLPFTVYRIALGAALLFAVI